MKNCPKCRMESCDDAEWCWHCGYAYEEGPAVRSRQAADSDGPLDTRPRSSSPPERDD
jgi:hypothetical protein